MERHWMRTVDEGVEFDVWVVPGASDTRIVGLHDGALRVRVAAPPQGGDANRRLLALLAERTGQPVEIVRGHRSRRKTVHVRNGGARTIAERLGMGDST